MTEKKKLCSSPRNTTSGAFIRATKVSNDDSLVTSMIDGIPAMQELIDVFDLVEVNVVNNKR